MSQLILYFICTLFFVLALIFYFLHQRRRFVINQWKKSLNLKEHAQVFHQLYQEINGFMLSLHARQKHDAMEYLYGEIEFLSFIALLSLAKIDEKTIFYDLGSGTGKAVIACGMVFPTQQCIGIELFSKLHAKACTRLEQLHSLKPYKEKTKKIKFILADFFEANFNDATLIFINSTAFFGLTWEKLCLKLEKLPHLKTVITTSKTLTSTHFSVILRTRVEMSWGVVFAYIHMRKTIA